MIKRMFGARTLILIGLLADLALIIIRVASYLPMIELPGSIWFVAKAIAALLICAAFVLISGRFANAERFLKPATRLGLIGGFLLTAHMGLEVFDDHVGESARITLTFMAVTFALWAVAGYSSARIAGTRAIGLIAGGWSAIISVVLAVGFGFSLMFFNLPAESYVATWKEFRASGWNDVRAFAIANSLDSAFTHLLTALVAGATLGGVGALVSRLTDQPHREGTH